MRVLIISDTHSNHKYLRRVFESERPRDLVIHLGDSEGCEDYIKEDAKCPVEIVSGNCDFFSSLEQEKVLKIGKYNVFITHGHYYNVNVGLDSMVREAKGQGCDIVMFGHTHRPLLDYSRDIIVVNPGSLSYPRQEGRKPSYVVMEIDEKGEPHFKIQFL